MGYAIKQDGSSWRAVDGPGDIGIDETYLTEQPEETLAQAQDRVWDAIKSSRELIKAGGVQVGGKWFHTDSDSRTQHLGLKDEARDVLAAGGSMDSQLIIDGAAVVWKTMDGTFIPVTAQLAFDIVAAAKVLDKRAFANAEAHRAAMAAVENPFEYDFSTGWPASYTPEV